MRLKKAVNALAAKLNYRRMKRCVVYTCGQDVPVLQAYDVRDFDYVYFGQDKEDVPAPWIYVDIRKLKRLA